MTGAPRQSDVCATPRPIGSSRFVFVLEQTLGQVAHTRNIERALAEEPSIDPTVIHLRYGEPEGLRGRLPGLRTWTFSASLQARSALRCRLREGPVDAAFIHTQVAAVLASRLMGSVPTIVSLDATPINFDQEGEAYGHRRNRPLLESAKRRLNQRPLGRAAAVVAWCRWAATSLVEDYGIDGPRVHVIPPGVDVGLFHPPDGARGVGERPVRVLFVGGQFDRKGGNDLLEAMRQLGPRAELDVVTGSEALRVPAGVTARVHRGLQPQSPELVRLYRDADVFALPSRGDCMPQAVAEALASGLPVVATGVGAIPEMVHDGVNGYLVASGNPRGLAGALNALVTDPGRRTAFGRWSRVVAEQEHDAGKNNRAIFDLMRSISPARSAGTSR
jgi:glycosyltransferase involved in cell wall biosynthesis